MTPGFAVEMAIRLAKEHRRDSWERLGRRMRRAGVKTWEQELRGGRR